jgi:hypothetical protein
VSSESRAVKPLVDATLVKLKIAERMQFATQLSP